MYSVAQYSEMIADGGRMDAYARALKAAVRPGSVVLDIGTGTGIAAVLACRFGARRVFALEPSDAIFVAAEVAAANGCGDTIEFMRALSTEVDLPEPADVIVSDLRGVLPVFDGHLEAIMDARRRHLAPGGTLVPRCDRLFAAVVAAPRFHASITGGWAGDPTIDFGPARRLAVNSVTKLKAAVEMLSKAACIGTIDYRSVQSPEFRGEAGLRVERPGTAHGLCVWFDSTLSEGVEFSNAPGAPALIYGQAFFPWTEPVALRPGDEVTAGLSAHMVRREYVWQWHSRVAREEGSVVAEFRQSEFLGQPVSLDALHKRSDSHVPLLREEGRIDRLVLQRMEASMPLGQIARELAAAYPSRFARWEDALAHVADLSVKYTE